MDLYHLSENSEIEEFVPRTSKAIWKHEKYVWAVAVEKAYAYYVPRDCPRICLSIGQLDVLAAWLPAESVLGKKALMLIPDSWETRWRSTVLYQYQLDPRNFFCIDSIAGYYVSRQREIPLRVQTIENCPALLAVNQVEVLLKSEAELRVIQEVVVHELQDFSIIRWGNL